ncbi:MAG: hypothetical protein O2826_09150 [Chloroflexi bacterium]|nr:hypothetical protein [Chloroflexota bacterium]
MAIVVTSIIVVVDEGDAVASVLPGPAVSYTTSWDSTKYLETNFYDIQENRGHSGIFNPSFGSPRVAPTPTAAV